MTILVWVVAFKIQNNNLRIIFCDVGQGDAVLITQNSFQVLIDGGPDNKVNKCLGKFVPFWDRKIEIVVLTHPQSDHMTGLIDVINSYTIENFYTGIVGNETVGFKEFSKVVSKTLDSNLKNLYAGDKVRMKCPKTSKPCIEFEVVWPTREWVSDHIESNFLKTDTSHKLASVLGFASDGTDLNSYSLGLELRFGQFNALFTGDADTQIEPQIIAAGLLNDIELLKVSHHGSKTGMSLNLLHLTQPEIAVISVGRNNKYGHPRKETIDMLRDEKIKTLRTDVDGDVVIETDGVRWSVVK